MAIRSFALRFDPGELVRIDIAGSSTAELRHSELVFTELGRALHRHEVNIRLVGPDLPEDANHAGFRNVSVTLHKMQYEDLLTARTGDESSLPSLPHLVIAFNAGIQ